MTAYEAFLIPLAPLVAALLTSLPIQWVGPRNYRFGLWAHVVTFGFAIALLLQRTSSDGAPVPLALWESNWTFCRLSESPLTAWPWS